MAQARNHTQEPLRELIIDYTGLVFSRHLQALQAARGGAPFTRNPRRCEIACSRGSFGRPTDFKRFGTGAPTASARSPTAIRYRTDHD